MMPASSIDPVRLLANLRELAKIGKESTGVCRIAYSASDIAAREWLSTKFQDAGLSTQIDRVGNVFGRWPGVDKALLIGSHTDSVPTGGWLDGSLGVIYGLEIALSLSKSARSVGVDVVNFADEEGTFAGWFGSRTFCNEFDETAWPNLKDPRNRTLAQELTHFKNHPAATLDRSRTVGYLEAHIEQGPRLEAAQKAVGIVTSIVGIRSRRVKFFGRADHAGTTPMNMREDASYHLVSLTSRLWERFQAARGPDTVWNFGNIIIKPGAANVVPAEGELFVQYRDSNPQLLEAFDAILAQEVDRLNSLETDTCSVSTTMATEPVQMDSGVRQVLREAAQRCDQSYIDIPSGAGHDAAVLARYVPTGMLFIPSKDGRSHTFDEDTDDKDIIAGAEVMLASVERLLDMNS